MITRSLILLLLVAFFGASGCVSHNEYAARRTAQLREIYPAGMTRESIQTRWGQTKPEFSATRPANGWSTYTNQVIAKQLMALETATGKNIQSLEQYWGPDGLFSLCYCWFFYDADNKIVDVEWQYKSD
jgi:hypothetical protein